MFVAIGEPADKVTSTRTQFLNPAAGGIDSRVHRSDYMAVVPSAALRIPEMLHIAWKFHAVSEEGF
jgi:hypothetical protein